jgi:DNA-binding transcriptional LysR family regulator
MRRIVFDLEVLRSFVTGIELGSFAKAADRLGRSTSAVSAQLKKLEDQVGQPILRKAGRSMVLTTVGETVLGYARRLLELNDEAAGAVRGVDLEGRVRLGVQQDFGEHVLIDILSRFARAHPKIRIETKIARNTKLLDQVSAGQLDLAVAWNTGVSTAHFQELGKLPMRWIGSGSSPITPPNKKNPLPLVMLETPCMMRSTATTLLDRAGISWRIAFTSPSLSGVWAAVAAGLGITVRTEIGLPNNIRAFDSSVIALPALPLLGLTLHRAEAKLDAVTQRLWDIILDTLQQSCASSFRV